MHSPEIREITCPTCDAVLVEPRRPALPADFRDPAGLRMALCRRYVEHATATHGRDTATARQEGARLVVQAIRA